VRRPLGPYARARRGQHHGAHAPGLGAPGPRAQLGPAAHPAAEGRHDLPVPLSRFVGREREIARLGRLLASQRLVTLTGVGGVGKSRLALEAASQALKDYPDGVRLVELAPLAAPGAVLQALAATLGVRKPPGRPLLDSVVEWLRPRRILLILDNCEHLIDACATLAATLLRACPRLAILATSREPLRIDGEVVQPVLPLSLPDPRASLPPDELARAEAVRLFVDRAAGRENSPSAARPSTG